MAEPVHPMAVAMQWVSRVFAASLMMVLPGLGGQWLDRRWGTGFFGLVGFGLGLIGGVAYLIGATRQADVARRRDSKQGAMGKGATDGSVIDGGAEQERGGRGPRPPQQ